MVDGRRSPVPVADAVITGKGDSPRPDAPVATARMSEPSVPAPACTTTGANRMACGTPAKGAGKALARGSVVVPPRDASSWQP